jgi:hypothetical protein
MSENQKKARPANGLSPSFAKATAGNMKIRNGTMKNIMNMATDMGRKYIFILINGLLLSR